MSDFLLISLILAGIGCIITGIAKKNTGAIVMGVILIIIFGGIYLIFKNIESQGM